jgi:hypothetical protein
MVRTKLPLIAIVALGFPLAAQVAPSFESLELEDGRSISYRVQREFAVVQGDILIGRAASATKDRILFPPL